MIGRKNMHFESRTDQEFDPRPTASQLCALGYRAYWSCLIDFIYFSFFNP